MADWEAENYVADLLVETVVVHDKWEGEDQDDEDIKDNWDDGEDEEEDETAEKAQTIGTATKASEKKRQSDKTKESKLKKRQEEETPQARPGDLTAEEQLAESFRAQKLQVEADLDIAKDLFGVCVGASEHATGLDAMCPSSKDDFAEFERLLKEKMTRSERSAHYPSFLDSLFRELCLSLDVEELRRINNSLSALLSEKQKLEKQNKGKTAKKKKGAIAGGGLKAKMGRDDMDGFDGALGDSYAQDYENFM